MNKKHFEAIAEVLNANVTPLATVLDMADALEEFNPLFNRDMFVRASTQRLLDQTHWTASKVAQAHGL